MQSWYCPSSLPDQGSLNAKVATRWLGLTGKTNLGTLMDLMKSWEMWRVIESLLFIIRILGILLVLLLHPLWQSNRRKSNQINQQRDVLHSCLVQYDGFKMLQMGYQDVPSLFQFSSPGLHLERFCMACVKLWPRWSVRWDWAFKHGNINNIYISRSWRCLIHGIERWASQRKIWRIQSDANGNPKKGGLAS